MREHQAINLIQAELRKAKEKHEGWPGDEIYMAAILGEEAGEVLQAALDYKLFKGDIEQIAIEAAQTGAMAIRLLMNLKRS